MLMAAQRKQILLAIGALVSAALSGGLAVKIAILIGLTK